MKTGGVFPFLGTVFFGIFLSGCTWVQPAPDSIGFSVPNRLYALQNSSEDDLRFWNTASQGSRLVPLTWLMALQSPTGRGLFTSRKHMRKFGFVYDGPLDALPVGLAVDRQADDKFKVTGIRWYQGQSGSNAQVAEPWAGLSCAACHTSELKVGKSRVLIAGGPAPLDFQSFVGAMDKALSLTLADPARFQQFASRVLGHRVNKANNAKLANALAKLIDWQEATARLDEVKLRYGPGRVDAFGRLANKVALFVKSGHLTGSPPFAPVSYPHLWNSHRQARIQWNGSALNFITRDKLRPHADLGALTRNAGEVIGVFGEVAFKANTSDTNYSRVLISSLNVPNLKKLEGVVTRFEAPKWPPQFPDLSVEKMRRGKVLYEQNCAECHLPKDANFSGGSERMTEFRSTSSENLTDIWMACNFYTATVPSGKMEGAKSLLFGGPLLGPIVPTALLLDTVVISSLLGKLKEIAVELPPQVLKLALSGTLKKLANSNFRIPVDPDRSKAQRCLTDNHEDLAYKARPLDGIWATAPFLHNGSVPTLYDLLLPAKDRPRNFWLGGKTYDVGKVGFVNKQTSHGRSFLYRTRDKTGRLIAGNANVGHEYGVRNLSEIGRMDLVEYLKSL